MLLLKEYIKTVLLEGKLEHETTFLSRKIVNKIKENIPLEPGAVSNHKISEIFKSEKFGKIIIFVGLYAVKDSTPKISASYKTNNLDKLIYLTIDLPEDATNDVEIFNRWFSFIVPRIKESLRHELEHAGQSKEKLRAAIGGVGKGTVKEYYKYLMSQAETEAWTAGLYKHAKMKKRPLIDLIDDVMEQFRTKFRDEANVEAYIASIRAKWLHYVKKRFPKAVLK
jgi:hypothetical protein